MAFGALKDQKVGMVAIMCMMCLSTIQVPCKLKNAVQMIRMLEGMLVASYRKIFLKKVALVFLLPKFVILLSSDFYFLFMNLYQCFFIYCAYIVSIFWQALRRWMQDIVR